MIRGYHVYMSIWAAEIGEYLSCARDVRNSHDPYAVSVNKGSTTVGHIPRMISCVCYTFLRRGGTIHCRVTGQRRHSSDLPQGGLEIPCLLEFVGKAYDVAKVIKLLPDVTVTKDSHESSNTTTVDLVNDSKESQQLPSKKIRITEETELTSQDVSLMEKEYEIISKGEKLSDTSINKAQELLKETFPTLNGLDSSLLQNYNLPSSQMNAKNKLQIIHCRLNHWIVASSVGLSNEVAIYDSLYSKVDHKTECLIRERFPSFKVKMAACQKQYGGTDCGLFAIANATAIAFSAPIQFTQHNMRAHLLSCFKNNSIVPFT